MKQNSLFAVVIIAAVGLIAIYFVLTAATVKVERIVLSPTISFGNAIGVTEEDLVGLPSLRSAIELADENYSRYLEDVGNQTDAYEVKLAPAAEVRTSIIEGRAITERFQVHESSTSTIWFDSERKAYVLRTSFGW